MADPYLTPDEVRERVPTLTQNVISDDKLADLIAEFEEIAEDYRGVAFTPRDFTDTFTNESCWSSPTLQLSRPMVRSVASVTVDGLLTAAGSYRLDGPAGALLGAAGFSGEVNVVVGSHGLDAPPRTLVRATCEYCRAVAQSQNSGVSRNVLSQASDGGTTRYSTPDKAAGRPTGFLEVDRLLNSLPDYRIPGIA